jgi:hypothetical protein
VSVDPTGADLKRFLEEDRGGPVVMLNLLRFAPEGRASYGEYSRRILPFFDRVGGVGTRCWWCAIRAARRSAGWSPTPSTKR